MRLALAFVLALTTPLAAQDLSVTDRDAFRAEVRAYLLENPEVIMEAIGVLQEREEQQAARADLDLVAMHADALFNEPSSFVGGNPNGDITVVEFLDYRCGYCRRAHPEVEELVKTDGQIRYIVKELPILGDASLLASRFALAVKLAYGDAAYKAMHDTLMTMRGELNDQTIARLAEEAGMELNPILIAMRGEDVATILRRNRLLAQAMQINGTPTFVVQDLLLRGYLPLEEMRNVVAEERG